jgi:uncharacterized protein
MITRTLQPYLLALATQYPVVTVTGPRQSGKTTLCRAAFPDKPYANLESPDTRQFAINDPRAFLAQFPDGAILDEIQRAPDLLSYLQVMVDADNRSGRFILTGSQQFEMMTTISQSLAGRTALLKLLPFSIEELAATVPGLSVDHLLVSGFYPRIHDKGLNPTQALGDYLETYVERDLRQLINIKDLGLFEKFVRLCAGRAGQLLNMQEIGNEAGVSHTTARAWITLLEASYIIHLLRPWYGNISKRLVKMPKLYFYDVGLASYLLGIEHEGHIARHPLRGALFENLAVMEALKYRYHRGRRSNLNFYRDAKGHEVDLVISNGPELRPIEIKSGTTITGDHFKGLRYFGKEFPTAPAGALIYGGNEYQERSEATVCPVLEMTRLLKGLEP